MQLTTTKLLILFVLQTFSPAQATIIQYQEDPYSAQAPQELIDQAEQIAATVGFKEPYHLVVPKKAGVEINAWNRYISYGSIPQTQAFFILVNQEWFAQAQPAQQEFLFARCFVAKQFSNDSWNFAAGWLPVTIKALPYLWMLFIMLLTIALFLALKRSLLRHKKVWIQVLAAWAAITASNMLFMNNIYTMLTKHLNERFDNKIIENTISKTGNKAAAIEALEYLDASIKKDLAAGESALASYEHTFENYAQQLKQQP